MSESIRICPSILNADHSNLSLEIDKIAKACDFLHLDIMDNVFVPNSTFSFEESEQIVKDSPIPVDAHLMIHNPDELASDYARIGCASVTFHLEASNRPLETIAEIRALGSRAGLAIKPNTSFEKVAEFIQHIDMLLIMTVEPGFGGQKFMEDMMEKVIEARVFLDSRHLSKIWLQVDGGINLLTIEKAARSGADTFVAGSAIFGAFEPAEVCKELRTRALASKLK